MIKTYALMKKQNTYCVGILFKGVSVQVVFDGGNVFRGIPARLTTRDAFKQRAIENSGLFRDKVIVLEKNIEEESDREERARQAAAKAARRAKRVKQLVPLSVQGGTTPPSDEPPGAPEEGDGSAALTAQATDESAGAPKGGDDDGAAEEKLEFGNLGEAILYIAEHYHVQVQSAYEAREFLKEREGKKVTIHNG